MRRRIFSLLSVLALLGCMATAGFAHEIPELVNGSITFHLRYEGEEISGGSLSIYRVGLIAEEDGNYFFQPIPGLPETEIPINETENPRLAAELKEIALEQKLEACTVQIRDGVACFTDVAPGLYVVVQNEASPGYAAMAPFLISMPFYSQDGHYETTVEATPKVSIETEPDDGEEETTPTKPTEPSLPQTGQLNWPVPLMMAAGVGLFIIGWTLRFTGRKKSSKNENQ